MVTVASVLVDFDGTACLHDVASDLLDRFGDPSWPDLDAAWARGEIDGRIVLSTQAAMLRTSVTELVDHAVAHCPMDPTFRPFVEWCRDRDVPVTVVSDGFGFYIPPMLEHVGVGDVPVVTNSWSGDGTLRFPDGHPRCIGCGTCKKQAVERDRAARGAVAFVGEGLSDRFGARYADVAFAKVGEALIRQCEVEDIPFVPWTTFDDVRAWLEGSDSPPGPLGGEPCPGWWEGPSATR